MPHASVELAGAHSCLAIRPLWLLLAAVLLFASTGASCHQLADQYAVAPAPRALPQAPTLADVIRVVNDNSSRVQSLYTTDASISSGMLPSLKTSIALDRPRRFRLRAETLVTGPEVDLGSNDELFWFWVRRNQPPALYFCRHEQFATSPARRMLPVEPHWLIEALGITSFYPADQHDGPANVGAGRLRIQSVRQTLHGPMTKVTLVDEARGWVLEQHLYDERGERVASALASEHRRDQTHDVTLPREIEIQWPAAQLSLKIHVNNWRVNSVDAQSPSLWTMPEYPGWNPFDLGQAVPATPGR